MERTYEPVTADEAEVVGLVAYAALAAMTRLAKDGDQAPSITAHVEHARMSAAAFRRFEELEVWSAHRDLDLKEAAGQYSGLFDDLDARTRPKTWLERSIKTYVTLGIFGDMLHQTTQRHTLFLDQDVAWDLGQEQWVHTHLAPQLRASDEASARLSLWARRVAGEVLGLMRSTLFTHPNLAADPDSADAIMASVTKRHGERMAAIGLRA